MRHPLRPVIALLALLLLLSLDHGLPHRYVPDDTVVRCALGIARDLTSGEVPLLEAIAPPDGRYTTYPMLLPWLHLGSLGGAFAWGLVTGRWSGPGGFRAAVFEDPGVAWFPARLLHALLALLVPLAVYRAARELRRSRGESALAALMAGSSLLLVQYAHTTRPWAPMLAFGACSLWFSLRMLRRQRLRDVLAAFVAAGLAGASFQVGLMFLGVPVGAALLALARPTDGPRGRLASRLVLGVAAGALVLVLLGYPHLLLHHGADTAQGALAAQTDAAPEVDVRVGGQAFSSGMLGGARAPEVLRAWLGYDPALVLAGLVGVLVLLAQRRSATVALLVAAPPLAIGALFTLYDGTHVRYLMPATPFLGLGAGAVLAALARRGAAGRALAVVLIAVPLVQAARLDLLLGREDTRTLAASAIPGLLGPERRIACDAMGSRYGPPLLPRGDALAEVAAAGVWLGRYEGEALALWQAGSAPPAQARALVPVQRFWRYDSYYPTDFLFDGLSVEQLREAGTTVSRDDRAVAPVELADWLDAWRIDAFVQVDRLPDEARRAPLTALMARRGRLLWSISPTGAGPPEVAELPTDMAFPLTDLWRYERPGPWIRVWDLEGERG